MTRMTKVLSLVAILSAGTAAGLWLYPRAHESRCEKVLVDATAAQMCVNLLEDCQITIQEIDEFYYNRKESQDSCGEDVGALYRIQTPKVIIPRPGKQLEAGL